MITKLKHRLLLFITLFVTVILAAFVITINVIPVLQSRDAAYALLLQTADNQMNQSMSPAPRPDTIPEPAPVPNVPPDDIPILEPEPVPTPKEQKNLYASSNTATIQTNEFGDIIDYSSTRPDLYDSADIMTIVSTILQAEEDFGMQNDQYYFRRSINNGYLIILLDSFSVSANTRHIRKWSVIAGIIVWIVSIGLSILLSDKLTTPLALALEKQRQFISDAEHELKTPIAVISSNADVLQSEIGENKWLSHITTESKHMTFLINELMSLAVIDDTACKITMTRFNLSDTILQSALPFESSAFEKGMNIQFQIAPDIYCKGNQDQCNQLVTILLSNAIKYGNERGSILLSLSKQKKKAFFTVFNTGEGIPHDELEKIFERFYRVDKARSKKTGGHGLGLSIAKSIVESHGGTITVKSMYREWAQFCVQLPCEE